MVYSLVGDAIKMLLQLGIGARMAKIDVANAFRNVPVLHKIGIYWAWYGMTMFILITEFHLDLGLLQFCSMRMQMH